MCGICGVINRNPSCVIDPEVVVSMTRSLAHRGPDDEAYFIEGNAGLGHRRLSIIDLSGGSQPMFNEDGSIVVVFNGEIYNFSELRNDLISRGHQFKTRSDTETIVHAYEEYGEDCVGKMRGMFAFAVWDRKHQRLLLARDRLGIKPLYVHLGRGFIAFASEIKSLLVVPQVPRELDREALDLYLSLRYVPGPRTMFKDIFKLQPGHTLVFDRLSVRTRKYWDLGHETDSGRSKEDLQEEFRQLLEESIRIRLIAEVPLGVFLSGGLDSSAVLAAMHGIRGGERIKTFSVGYETGSREEEESNEFSYARVAARHFGAEHYEFRVKPEDFGDVVPDLVWHLDEPMADPTCIPLYFLSRLARRHVTVVLSGEGADEILAGYGIYARMLALEKLYPVARHFGPLLSWMASRIPEEKIRRYVQLAALPLEARYRGVSRGLSREIKRKLLGQSASFDPLLDQVFKPHMEAVDKSQPLERMLHLDIKTWLVEDLLMKADKMTMAHGLELRVPFLDHKLVEFAATLPPPMKLTGRGGKYILRESMRGILPKSILERKKKGFPVPWRPWLRTRLRHFTREVLLDHGAACRFHLDAAAVEQTVKEHESGRNREQELWALLIFEFWHRQFMAGPPAERIHLRRSMRHASASA